MKYKLPIYFKKGYLEFFLICEENIDYINGWDSVKQNGKLINYIGEDYIVRNNGYDTKNDSTDNFYEMLLFNGYNWFDTSKYKKMLEDYIVNTRNKKINEILK